MNAIATLDNNNCPCCAIEQDLTQNNNVDQRVCNTHYARENAVWQAYLAGKEAWDALQSTPSHVERFHDGLELF